MMGKKEVIAVDLGGTNLRVALVKRNKILKYIKKRTPKKKEEISNELIKTISDLMNPNVKGIGVASIGPLKNGVIINTPNLPFKKLDIKGLLTKKFKKEVVVENDANCVALAEARYGCKKKNFFILTFGTGVGGGIIIDKKLYKGNENAGELGHIILDKGKDFEKCWQQYKNKKKIKELLYSNNKTDKKDFKQLIVHIGQGIASLINILDPEVVILMGGVRETGNKFLMPIKKEVKKYVKLPDIPKIKWSRIPHPGILGASLLIE